MENTATTEFHIFLLSRLKELSEQIRLISHNSSAETPIFPEFVLY